MPEPVEFAVWEEVPEDAGPELEEFVVPAPWFAVVFPEPVDLVVVADPVCEAPDEVPFVVPVEVPEPVDFVVVADPVCEAPDEVPFVVPVELPEPVGFVVVAVPVCEASDEVPVV